MSSSVGYEPGGIESTVAFIHMHREENILTKLDKK